MTTREEKMCLELFNDWWVKEGEEETLAKDFAAMGKKRKRARMRPPPGFVYELEKKMKALKIK